jgi:ubiquinone/menaquinone biosynthesis C-methylase UbiE
MQAQHGSALQSQVGQRILDLGCGTGDDARALARLVAPGGQVIGVGSSCSAAAQEQGRLSEPDVVRWLEPLRSAAQSGRFFAALTGFIVAGRKP